METKPGSVTQRSSEDFDPISNWRREENRDTIDIHLPGFKRDQLKIQVNHRGFLVISAERHLEGNRWKSFRMEIEVPGNCNIDAIHASFANNILSVVMPKKNIPPLSEKHQELEEDAKQEKDNQEENVQKANRSQKYTEEETKRRDREELKEEGHYHGAKYKFEEHDAKLTPEATSHVAFRFLVVVIVILIIANYVADVCKDLMAQAHSYL